jgi:hypothetical protein
MLTRCLTGLLGGALLALGALPSCAWADAIDGHWCWQSRHMQIEGPRIVTPGGKPTTGNYTRHAFSYVVPPAEPDAGQTVNMTLVNENIVHLWVGAAGASSAGREPQVWQRCAAPSA